MNDEVYNEICEEMLAKIKPGEAPLMEASLKSRIEYIKSKGLCN